MEAPRMGVGCQGNHHVVRGWTSSLVLCLPQCPGRGGAGGWVHPSWPGSEQPGSHSDASADTLTKGLGVPLAGGPIEVLGGWGCAQRGMISCLLEPGPPPDAGWGGSPLPARAAGSKASIRRGQGWG